MIRTVTIAATAAILITTISDPADARRRAYYRLRKPAPIAQSVTQPAVNTVRVIPIRRWRLWCDRIGGSDCP